MYGVFTVAYAPTAATLPTPVFTPATASSIVTITIPAIALISPLSIDYASQLKFEFDPKQFKTTISSASSNAASLSTSAFFFSYTAASLATPYTLAVNNIKTPAIIGNTWPHTRLPSPLTRSLQVLTLTAAIL